MSVTEYLASGSRLRRNTQPSDTSDKALKRSKGRKGKGKDGDTGTVATARAPPVVPDSETTASTPGNALEELPWDWVSLTDSAVKRESPVFTKDGRYVDVVRLLRFHFLRLS
jgi:hypothetical protein